jgi:formylglycine-generating enzyme required for sulfatase activity
MRRIPALALMFTIASHAVSAEPPSEFTNSIGMKFRLIPAGEFMMGSSESPEELAAEFTGTKPRWYQDAHPQHHVRITKPFYMGLTEVTQKQYEKVMGENPSWFSKTGDGANRVQGIDTSNFPVESVSWDDAVEFCKKLSDREGVTYRLPTEAEWEYACRAGTTTRYCFGDDPGPLQQFAWFKENSKPQPNAVGQKKPNHWGLHDLHGNVLEWCSDSYDPDYYRKPPKDEPTAPAAFILRVYRGGSWSDHAGICQSSVRNGSYPQSPATNKGFRVARDLSASKPESK